MLRKLLFLGIFLSSFSLLSAQDDGERSKGKKTSPTPAQSAGTSSPIVTFGTIRGLLKDKETGEEIIEAAVTIQGTEMGNRTDLDGAFTLHNIPAGIYTLVATYIGYQNLTVTDVEVKGGQVTALNMFLVPEGITTETVVIEAKAVKNNEASVLNLQRVSSVSLDGISLAQTSRNGDNTAAAALGRVTGLTVESGRYVYVRGLGDRYNKTLVNGAEVPGLDPVRNSVQLDMFPANLIDNIIVYKAFAPDLPGSFTGGLIDIATRDFPEKATFSANVSLGFNDQATFNKNYLLYQRGSWDWFGADYGSRAVPNEISQGGFPEATIRFTETPENLRHDRMVKNFGGDMYPTVQSNFLDHAFSISGGNQVQLFGRPLGFIASVTYRRNYTYYENGTEALYRSLGASSERLQEVYNYSDRRGTDAVLFGALMTLSYKITPSNRLSLTYNHSHAGDASARKQEGVYGLEGVGQFRENRVMQYLDRSINIVQLRGEHFFPKLKSSKLEWTSSLVYLKQSEPDLRFFTNEFSLDPVTGQKTYSMEDANYFLPIRFFRTMDEFSQDHRLHFTLPIKLGRDESKIKAGGAYTQKFRAPFREFRYDYDGSAFDTYNGNPSDLFAPSNLGLNPATGDWGMYLKDASDPANSYDGQERVTAGYIMGDLGFTRLIRLVTGVRVENTYMRVENTSVPSVIGEIKTTDLLPCFNLIFRPSIKSNIRINYGRTVARPILREMATYANFDFIGGVQVIGSNELTRTLIDNIDLKWEYFPSNNEVISFGAFYKNFTNPIERTFNPEASSPEIEFKNVDRAISYGLEGEFRKRFLKVLQAGANASLIFSRVDVDLDELIVLRNFNPDAPATRPMFAQSPFIINANIGYVNDSLGFSAIINYNVFGRRLMEVSAAGTPDVFELPRHSVDLNLQYKRGRFIYRLNLQNLVNPKFRFVQEFRGEEYTFREFTMGRRISLSISYQF